MCGRRGARRSKRERERRQSSRQLSLKNSLGSIGPVGSNGAHGRGPARPATCRRHTRAGHARDLLWGGGKGGARGGAGRTLSRSRALPPCNSAPRRPRALFPPDPHTTSLLTSPCNRARVSYLDGGAARLGGRMRGCVGTTAIGPHSVAIALSCSRLPARAGAPARVRARAEPREGRGDEPPSPPWLPWLTSA